MATPMLCVSVGAAILLDWSVPYKQRNSVCSERLSGLYHRGSKGRGEREHKRGLYKPVTYKILQRDFTGLGKKCE